MSSPGRRTMCRGCRRPGRDDDENVTTPSTRDSDPLSSCAIVIQVPIAWADMDAFGHVNNTVYFRFFESVRIAYLDAIGFTSGGVSGGVGPILASTHCRFRHPLRYPDSVTVGTRVPHVDADRFTMEYVVVSDARGVVAAEGGGVVVAYDYGVGSKVPIPDDVRRRMDALSRTPPASSESA